MARAESTPKGSHVLHATEFLRAKPADMPGVIVLTGEERVLKTGTVDAILKTVLPNEDDAPTRFSGKDASLTAVRDELQTVSMWGDRRVVIVEDAADFVSEHRAALEKYAAAPSKKSVLILDVKTLPKNTKLFGIVSAQGLIVECTELKGAALTRWIQEIAQQEHSKKLTREAVDLLVELAGTSIGLLEQELQKLSSYAGEQTTIDAEMVRKMVGGWRAETTWAMTDAVREGRSGDAISMLDKLLASGEAPLRVLGGISFVFRKMALATELSRQGRALNAALQEAGCWGNEVGPATSYLRRIGRPKAELIGSHLLAAESALKGGSLASDRSILERLLLQLSGTL